MSADAKFCANCGAMLQAPTRLATAPTPAYTPPSPLADLGSRIATGIVDYIIIGIVAGILWVLVFVPWIIAAPLKSHETTAL